MQPRWIRHISGTDFDDRMRAMTDPWSPRYFTADAESAGRLVERLAEAYPQLPRKSVREVLDAHTRGLSTGRPYQRVVCGPPDALWASAHWRVPPVLARNDIVLFDVVVAEVYRGQGHGSRLLGTVVDAARACGASMLGLGLHRRGLYASPTVLFQCCCTRA